jgi:hypothetical protein
VLQNHPHLDLAAVGEFHGVPHQIQEHLPQPARIAAQGVWHLGIDVGQERQPFFAGILRHRPENSRQRLSQAKIGVLKIQPAGFDLGEIQDIIDHREQGVRRRFHGR